MYITSNAIWFSIIILPTKWNNVNGMVWWPSCILHLYQLYTYPYGTSHRIMARTWPNVWVIFGVQYVHITDHWWMGRHVPIEVRVSSTWKLLNRVKGVFFWCLNLPKSFVTSYFLVMWGWWVTYLISRPHVFILNSSTFESHAFILNSSTFESHTRFYTKFLNLWITHTLLY